MPPAETLGEGGWPLGSGKAGEGDAVGFGGVRHGGCRASMSAIIITVCRGREGAEHLRNP